MSGAEDFDRLARRLKEAGEKGLRAELNRALNDSVKPFAKEISAVEYLKPYMPDRYAEVLARDLGATTVKRSSAATYGVAVKVQGRVHRRRQVRLLNRGLLRHPVFADSDIDRRDWEWKTQTGGMVPGFFDDAVKAAAPEIRQQMINAIQAVEQKVAKG